MLLAIVGALVIGLCLGLLGSGGSILTLPVLVFLLGRPEKVAIPETLAIVGSVALLGAIPYAWRKQVSGKSVLLFGLPGMAGALTGSSLSLAITAWVQLILFACVMLAASGLLLFGPASFEQGAGGDDSRWMLALKGFVVGCLSGLLGVGGGFLIVPALIMLCHLPVIVAVGTSLVIISLNSFTGFIEQLFVLHYFDMHVSWQVIGLFSLTAILGCLAGSLFSKRVPQIKLRRILGVAIFAIGICVLFSQL